MKLSKLFLIVFLVVMVSSVVFSDTSYFRELVNKGNATYYDAYRIITILQTGKDDSQSTFENFRDKLMEQGIIPKKWDKKQSGDFPNRGEIAYMLFKTLGFKGGLTVRIFGLSCRYAFRECVNKKLMAQGYPNQLLAGEELISILAETEKYQEKQTAKQSSKQINTQEKQQKEAQKQKEEEKKPQTEREGGKNK